MKITLMVDINDSFFLEYKDDLLKEMKRDGNRVQFINNKRKIKKGDVLLLVSCKSILKKSDLKKNKYNVVIHPSKLPYGKGSASVSYSILKNRKKIYITLFEASENLDSGDIYLQDYFKLEGTELSDEIRFKQAKLTSSLIINFLKKIKKNQITKLKQKKVNEKILKKRFPKDSELNINKTIKSQINLIRTCDNLRYPGFFYYKKKKFIIKFYKDDDKKNL